MVQEELDRARDVAREGGILFKRNLEVARRWASIIGYQGIDPSIIQELEDFYREGSKLKRFKMFPTVLDSLEKTLQQNDLEPASIFLNGQENVEMALRTLEESSLEQFPPELRDRAKRFLEIAVRGYGERCESTLRENLEQIAELNRKIEAERSNHRRALGLQSRF